MATIAKTKNKLSPKLAKIAAEVTRRILETVQPQRVLLFGSSWIFRLEEYEEALSLAAKVVFWADNLISGRSA
jgi:hypothetical protein